MEITYPISSSRFLLAMQVYARKMASYETYEEVKKREFERISLFRPLPTVSRESIKTEVVKESPRYLLDTEGSEDETVELDSLFDGFESIQDSDWLTSMKSKEEEVENRDEEEEQDPLKGVSFVSLGLSSSSSDDEQELELREFEVDPSEDFSDLLSNSPESSLTDFEIGLGKTTPSQEKSNLSQSETSESNLESEPTRVEFKDEIFRSDYVGKREPWTYVAKEKEVAKPKVVERPKQVEPPKQSTQTLISTTPKPPSVPKPTNSVSNPSVKPQVTPTQPRVQRPQPTQSVQANDKTVRLVNEDFVSYCRRNLRISEQVALGYFSPSEIESSVRQGKVLRKGGVLIFAHS